VLVVGLLILSVVADAEGASFSSRYSMMYSNSVILSLMTSASSPWDSCQGVAGRRDSASLRNPVGVDMSRQSLRRLAQSPAH
jgi:hypothetical protein